MAASRSFFTQRELGRLLLTPNSSHADWFRQPASYAQSSVPQRCVWPVTSGIFSNSFPSALASQGQAADVGVRSAEFFTLQPVTHTWSIESSEDPVAELRARLLLELATSHRYMMVLKWVSGSAATSSARCPLVLVAFMARVYSFGETAS